MTLDVKKLMAKGSGGVWISEPCIALVNERIRQEEQSARIYLGMSVWLDVQGYSGAAKLWKKYSDEELEHAEAFYDYLKGLNIVPEVPVLTKPANSFSSLLDVVEKSLEHELYVTKEINRMASEALKMADMMLYDKFLQYVREQHEELNKLLFFREKLEINAGDTCGLLMIDKEMGKKA